MNFHGLWSPYIWQPIRNSGPRQEAQDDSLAITRKYDNIPFCCASEWGNNLSVTSVRYRACTDARTAAHGFGTMMIRQQSIWKCGRTYSDARAIQNCHNGNRLTVPWMRLIYRHLQNLTIRISTNKYIINILGLDCLIGTCTNQKGCTFQLISQLNTRNQQTTGPTHSWMLR